MKTLITGAAGFVGRAFVKRCLAEGHKVTAIDDFSGKTGYPIDWAVEKNLGFTQVDCREYFRRQPPNFDLIIHCAAVVGGRLTIDGDPLAVATDLSIDSEFFNWLARAKTLPAGRVIYFSSSAVYPIELQTRTKHVALIESLVNFDALRLGKPDMTYGWSKLSGEYLAQFAAEKYGIPVITYRPFSGYGPGQSFDYPFPSIVQRVITSFRRTNVSVDKEPVVVWGSGDQLRDFVYIDDVVEAVFTTVYASNPGCVLNIGTGVPTSFRELAHRVAKVLGREIDVINDATKPEGVFARYADTHKLRMIYDPKVSLDEGIERVYQDLTHGLM